MAHWIVRESAVPWHWLHQGRPTEEEVLAKVSGQMFRDLESRRPWYAGTFIGNGGSKEDLERLLQPGEIESRLDRFGYFDSPSAPGIAHALICRWWYRWYPSTFEACNPGTPSVVITCTERGRGPMSWRLSMLIPDGEMDDEERGRLVTEVRETCGLFPGVTFNEHSPLELPVVDFGVQFKAAMRLEIQEMYDALG